MDSHNQPLENQGLRLVKIPPTLILSGWDILYPLLLKALPEGVEDYPYFERNLKEAFTFEELDLWALKDMRNLIEGQMIALFATYIEVDKVSKQSSLFIYALTLLDRAGFTHFRDGFALIQEIAKAKGCISISAYTALDRLKDTFQALGGKALWSLSMEV